MNKLNRIKELLKKFKEEDLLPSEAQDLASLTHNRDESDDFEAELEELWQESAVNNREDIPSERILARLKQMIPEAITKPGDKEKVSLIRMISPYFRYAAVIIFTAGLTWFVMDISVHHKVPIIPDNIHEAFNEISVPHGSKSRIVLPDGSVINLNSGSTLRYPARLDSTLRYAYIEGEAFFDVKKDPRNPFIVKTRDITIKVLGTKFNVKSYSDEKTVETTLVSGSIEIFSNQKPASDKPLVLVLKPNEQAVFEKLSGDIVISERPENMVKKRSKSDKPFQVQKNIDVDPVIAWKDNRLPFRDESFADLARKLERWYNVEIVIQDKELAQALFSGIFERETIEQALDALKLATPFEYKMNKNKIIISN